MPAEFDRLQVDKPAVDESLLAGAIEIARVGGRKTVEWFGRSELETHTKTDGSPVTQADRAAELEIRAHIEELTPDCTIVGEEHGTKTGRSPVTWHVDPIDGTKAFVRGIPTYATLISVEDEHGPAVGVIYIPALDDIVWAGRGRGAHNTSGRVHVSARRELNGAFLSTSCVSRWRDVVYQRIRASGINIHGWGDGYGFLLAATGRIDAMVDLHGLSSWDVAPLRVIMNEAGGRYSALDGTWALDTGNGVATNGLLHDDLLTVING